MLEGIADEDVDDIPGRLMDEEDADTSDELVPINEDVIPPIDELIGFMLDIIVEDDIGMDIDIDMLDVILLMLGLSPGLFPPIGVAVAVKVDIG